MNIFDILKQAQDFRSQLEVWGITSGFLWAVGFVSCFFFVLSTREVLGWYLRTNHLRDEVKAMRAQLQDLQAALDKLNEGHSKAAAEAEKAKEPVADGSKSFKLTHWRNSL
jgi:hypothetical protein